MQLFASVEFASCAMEPDDGAAPSVVPFWFSCSPVKQNRVLVEATGETQMRTIRDSAVTLLQAMAKMKEAWQYDVVHNGENVSLEAAASTFRPNDEFRLVFNPQNIHPLLAEVSWEAVVSFHRETCTCIVNANTTASDVVNEAVSKLKIRKVEVNSLSLVLKGGRTALRPSESIVLQMQKTLSVEQLAERNEISLVLLDDKGKEEEDLNQAAKRLMQVPSERDDSRFSYRRRSLSDTRRARSASVGKQLSGKIAWRRRSSEPSEESVLDAEEEKRLRRFIDPEAQLVEILAAYHERGARMTTLSMVDTKFYTASTLASALVALVVFCSITSNFRKAASVLVVVFACMSIISSIFAFACESKAKAFALAQKSVIGRYQREITHLRQDNLDVISDLGGSYDKLTLKGQQWELGMQIALVMAIVLLGAATAVVSAVSGSGTN